jgi:fluoride ion exporter CrcB/FEX
LPLGTLLVNVVGGLLIGMALVALARPEQQLWRLLLVTGFLGGLTTFSAFSAESLALLQRGAAGLGPGAQPAACGRRAGGRCGGRLAGGGRHRG